MNKSKRFLFLLLALLVIMSALPAAAAAKSSEISVTLSMEYADAALIKPVTFKVDTSKTFADYGLTPLSDPGRITPLHVIAAYFMKYEGAAKANMASKFIGASEGQYGIWLSTLKGSSGFKKDPNSSGYYWNLAINDTMPADGFGTNVVKNGDHIRVCGVWIGDYGSGVGAEITNFTKSAYTAVAGKAFAVKLEGYSSFSYGAITKTPVSGAKIMTGAEKTGATSGSVFVTDSKGRANIKFTKPGRYVISAFRKKGSIYDITRPYAIVDVRPAKVVGLSVKKASVNAVKLSWSKQFGAEGYNVYRAEARDGKYRLVTITPKAALTDKKLPRGKTYYYKVRAYKAVDGKKLFGETSYIKGIRISK